MDVLVAYATRHGSTAEVADRIGAVLRARGADVEVREVTGTEDVGARDALVLGSPVYGRKWLPQAVELARRNSDALAGTPVFTFSLGRLRHQRGLMRRVLWSDTDEIDELFERLHPRSHWFFHGDIRPARLTRTQRALFQVSGGRWGDYRDWDEIEAWADAVAEQLRLAPAPARAPEVGKPVGPPTSARP